jgi:hypothetical protein
MRDRILRTLQALLTPPIEGAAVQSARTEVSVRYLDESVDSVQGAKIIRHRNCYMDIGGHV